MGYLHGFVLLNLVCGILWGLMIEVFWSPRFVHLGIGLFFTAKGYAMSYVVPSRPCLHLNIMVFG
jgi:hypothetical protein